MSDFVPELALHEILVRLPPKDLIRCLCVSKSWNALIRQRSFIKSHVQRSIDTNSTRTILFRLLSMTKNPLFSFPLNDDDTSWVDAVELPSVESHIWGSSVHGLLCITTTSFGEVALWNPSIRKLKKVPSPNFGRLPEFGLGYDSVNDDYKVVGIEMHLPSNKLDLKSPFVPSAEARIYSLKSNSWKEIQNFPVDGLPAAPSLKTVSLNGCLIWICWSSSSTSVYRGVGALDLATEKFGQLLTPVHLNADDSPTLAVLGGCLCISVSYSDIRRDLWIMKEFQVTESWTLFCSIDQGAMPSKDLLSYCIVLGSSKNGEMVLFSFPRIADRHNLLFWYDVEKKSVKPVELHGLPGAACDPTMCVGSLCLLDGGIPQPVM